MFFFNVGMCTALISVLYCIVYALRTACQMNSSDELHDRADDAVVRIVGWFCICDCGFVAMELL